MRVFPLGGLYRTGVVFAAVVFAAGCGPSSATVSGKVAYNGTTVKGGHITFYAEDLKPYEAEIKEDGTYTVTKVAPGKMKVAVETDSLLQLARAGRQNQPPPGAGNPEHPMQSGADPEKAKRDYVPIPPKYKDAATTDLEFTVKAGSNTYDPPLKDK